MAANQAIYLKSGSGSIWWTDQFGVEKSYGGSPSSLVGYPEIGDREIEVWYTDTGSGQRPVLLYRPPGYTTRYVEMNTLAEIWNTRGGNEIALNSSGELLVSMLVGGDGYFYRP